MALAQSNLYLEAPRRPEKKIVKYHIDGKIARKSFGSWPLIPLKMTGWWRKAFTSR
jgi:hypothetical protein